MSNCNTIYSQLLKLVPRHDFERLAKQHHEGRAFRVTSQWDQFVALSLGQLSGRSSLRDISDNIAVQSHRLYHFGCRKVTRSN